MPKVIQVVNGICYWDATFVHPTLDSIMLDQYPLSVQFVEAPDCVREGWGYNETQDGDARFIEPVPPAGWLYDRETGTFYQDPNCMPPVEFDETANI